MQLKGIINSSVELLKAWFSEIVMVRYTKIHFVAAEAIK